MKGRNKLIIILGVSLLIVAGILFLVGGALSGWDLVQMFTGPSAIWAYIVIGTGMLFIVYIVISDWIKKI